jgi:hypothetical protein
VTFVPLWFKQNHEFKTSSTNTMNTQLVDSIIQIIQSLPKSEQNILREKLNQAVASEAEPIDEEAWKVWETLGDDAVPGCLENSSIYQSCICHSLFPTPMKQIFVDTKCFGCFGQK